MGEDLHDFRAQVRKFSVRIFMFDGSDSWRFELQEASLYITAAICFVSAGRVARTDRPSFDSLFWLRDVGMNADVELA